MDDNRSRGRAWHPSALVRLLIAIHPLALVGVLLWPAHWPGLLLAAVLVHSWVVWEGMWPRSHGLGRNITRLPASAGKCNQVAITIDDGPDASVTPAVLDILAEHQAQATFFCIGSRAQAHPELIRRLIEQGHAVENHTQHHRHGFALLGFRGMLDEIETAQNTLSQLTGRSPRFFRPPAGIRNVFLDPVLSRLDLRLASWTRRGFDTRASDADRVLQRLLSGLRGGDILLLHDGNAAVDARTGEPIVLRVLPRLLAHCRRLGLEPVTLAEVIR